MPEVARAPLTQEIDLAGLRITGPDGRFALPEYGSFAEFLQSLPARPLKALDVGCGEGEYMLKMAQQYPGRFANITGVDLLKGWREQVKIGETLISYNGSTTYEDFAGRPENQAAFDLVTFNCPDAAVWPPCLKTLSTLLTPGGAVAATFYWASFLSGVYRAFTEPEDVREYLEALVQRDLESSGFAWCLIPNDLACPETRHSRVPGVVVARPI